VRDRTHDLEVANRQLEAVKSGAGIVLLLVSHDLRAPLRAVQGFCQIFTEDFGSGVPPEGLKLLGHVDCRCAANGQLIEDILALSQLGGSRCVEARPGSTRSCSVSSTIFAQEIPGGTFRSGSGDLGECDCERIARRAGARQICCQTLFKFTKRQTPAIIEVDCQRCDEGPVFSVRDNGAGFDMK